jgi:hypothetical protein
VRRSIYNLLQTTLSIEGDFIDWRVISASFISKPLSMDQSGSASDLSELLLDMTRRRPQIWTDDYSGKTLAYKRLCQYIRKGSQSASPIYWQNLHHLLRSLPVEVLSGGDSQSADKNSITFQSATSLMETFKDGILSKDEHRGNLAAAWSSFIKTGIWISHFLPDTTTRQQFLDAQITPILERYVTGNPSQTQWTLPAQSALRICAGCILELKERSEDETLRPLWKRLSGHLLHSLNAAQAQSSNDFKQSQESICTQANHMFSLQAEILARISDVDKKASTYAIFEEAVTPLLECSIEVLRSQNGNAYGAAAVIEEAVRKTPSLVAELNSLELFLTKDVPTLLSSPSSKWVMSILLSCHDHAGYSLGLDKSIEIFLKEDKDLSDSPSLRKLFSSVNYEIITEHPSLERLVMQNLDRALKGARKLWPNISAIFENPTSQNGMADQILLSIVDNLSVDDTVLEALHGISHLLSQNKRAIQKFRNGPHGSKLLSKLLYLSESPVDEVANLSDTLDKSIKELATGDESTKTTVDIIQQNFDGIGADSLS